MDKGSIEFEQVVERGCGLDVHKETVVATIQGKGIKTMTKSYSTFTGSLEKLRDWLKSHGITHIAMESTGVYWKPIFNVLGDDFQILLVNARHVKNIPGHKTDKRDSRWLAKLLLCGLLKGSFIPPRSIRELRDLTRYRKKLIGQVSSEKNRIQKILEDANIKLSVVLTDVFCVTGQKILSAILEEEDYRPEELLKLVHGRVKAKRSDIVEALKGHVSAHHRFMLATLLENIGRLETTIAQVTARIEQVCAPYHLQVERLATIPGVGQDGAVGIIAEIGVDMEQFPSQQHLASWAGICPGSNESAGKNKSGRTTYGNHYIKALIVEMAWAASRSKGTYLAAKYKSLVGRRGKKKAIIAVGHKILIAAYFILRDHTEFKELGPEHLDNFKKDKLIAYYKKQLKLLDPTLELTENAA